MRYRLATNKQLADELRLLAHDEPRPERPELMRRAAERLEESPAPKTRITMELPPEAAVKIMADPEAFKAYAKANGFDVDSVAPATPPSLRQERTEPTPHYSFPTDDLSEALPNLDASNDPAELEHYAGEFHRIAWVFTRLQLYAQNKALAMQHRLAGDIRAAQDAEDHADLAYNVLPDWAKW